MKQIPFDLQRALAGDKVVTRDGREVTQLTKFDASTSAPVFGVVDEIIISCSTNGRYHGKDDSCLDLFMAPKTVKRWVNFYGVNSCCYDNEEDAKRCANKHASAIAVPVEFQEGYGCK